MSLKIMRNSEVRVKEFPLFSFPLPKKVFISCVICLLLVLLLYYFVMRLIRSLLESTVIRWAVLMQFKERLLNSVVGSKIEN